MGRIFALKYGVVALVSYMWLHSDFGLEDFKTLNSFLGN